MGDFIVKIHAQGGHGCERKAIEGEVFYGCGYTACPDCFWAKAVWEYKHLMGGGVHDATLTHWPVSMNKTHGRQYTETGEVVDDLNYFTKDNYFSPRLRKRIKGRFDPS